MYMKKTLLSICILFITALCALNLHAQFEPQKSSERTEVNSVSLIPAHRDAMGGSYRGPNSTLLYSTSQADPNPGVYTTTLENFAQPGTMLAPITLSYQAMEVVEGVIYVITYNASTELNTFGLLNPTTGAFTEITPYNIPDASSMAWNPMDNSLYVVQWGGGGGSPFGKINLASGTFTPVGTVPGVFYIAIDNEGICYGLDLSHNLFGTVDLTSGAFTQIKEYTDNFNRIQDLVIDRETNELYHNARFADNEISEWRKLNKTTGEATILGQLAGRRVESILILGGDPLPECDPASNLQVAYVEECEAELTWNAPATGNFTYNIYRDGDLIATVETASYRDLDFEPTLAHTWAVQVVCDDSYSVMTYKYAENCVEADCSWRPKNFSVAYNTDCDAATLNWIPPTEVLFDNFVNSGGGHRSMRWLWDTNSRNIIADDFDVPPGETWIITEVYLHGFYATTEETFDKPDYIGIEIFDDNGDNLPGNRIYEDAKLTPIIGTIGGACTMLLSEPVVISAPGKYWISYYGSYDNEYHDMRQFVVLCYPEEIGAYFAILDERESPEWEPFTGAAEGGSLSFKVQGLINNEPVKYNIYRDGLLIATDITDTFFEDTEFDATQNHRWSIKVACPLGGESAASLVNLPKCDDFENISEHVTTPFTIVPNPAVSTITITAKDLFKTVEVINHLGQTVMAVANEAITKTTFDISNLNSGVYFVRIITANGASVQKFVKQ